MASPPPDAFDPDAMLDEIEAELRAAPAPRPKAPAAPKAAPVATAPKAPAPSKTAGAAAAPAKSAAPPKPPPPKDDDDLDERLAGAPPKAPPPPAAPAPPKPPPAAPPVMPKGTAPQPASGRVAPNASAVPLPGSWDRYAPARPGETGQRLLNEAGAARETPDAKLQSAPQSKRRVIPGVQFAADTANAAIQRTVGAEGPIGVGPRGPYLKDAAGVPRAPGRTDYPWEGGPRPDNSTEAAQARGRARRAPSFIPEAAAAEPVSASPPATPPPVAQPAPAPPPQAPAPPTQAEVDQAIAWFTSENAPAGARLPPATAAQFARKNPQAFVERYKALRTQ